jgi:hypothetical protein
MLTGDRVPLACAGDLFADSFPVCVCVCVCYVLRVCEFVRGAARARACVAMHARAGLGFRVQGLGLRGYARTCRWG